jgi:preprotein translocase subunit SecE
VARETRRQRRDQRKSSGGKSTAGKPAAEPKAAAPRARARQAQVRPGMQAPSTQTGRREPRQRGRFVKESWGELQKVEWPSRSQVIQGTIVVLIACIIVGAFLYAADQGFKPFVRTVLLGE